MFGFKSPEAAKTLTQAFIFSTLVTVILVAVAIGTFVQSVFMEPVGIGLIIALLILDAAIVVPAILKIKQFEDTYEAMQLGRDNRGETGDVV